MCREDEGLLCLVYNMSTTQLQDYNIDNRLWLCLSEYERWGYKSKLYAVSRSKYNYVPQVTNKYI